MTGWNNIGDELISGKIDIAFMLAPYAMETFNTKQNIREKIAIVNAFCPWVSDSPRDIR